MQCNSLQGRVRRFADVGLAEDFMAGGKESKRKFFADCNDTHGAGLATSMKSVTTKKAERNTVFLES